jgi:hypothetical protein
MHDARTEEPNGHTKEALTEFGGGR